MDFGRDGSHIQLSVADNGEGIDPSFLPYVFNRFAQADSSKTRKHGGLGLGLAIVRHIVELHGGKVMAHSEGHDKGSTFIVQLPVPALHEQEHEAFWREPDNLSGLRVMLVEDDEDTRKIIAAMLQLSQSHPGNLSPR